MTQTINRRTNTKQTEKAGNKNNNLSTQDFLKTSTPEVWTKEVYRNEQFVRIENNMIEAEVRGDYAFLLKLARIYLRFQMEVMEEETIQKDEQGNIIKDEAGRPKKTKTVGMNTPLFKKQNDQISELEEKWREKQIKKADPSQRRNDEQEKLDLIKKIENLLAELQNNNTVFSLNYKKKNDVMKAAYQ